MAKQKIDFSGVPKEIRSGGGAAHVPEGDYLAKIVSGELRTSEKSGSRYYNWRCQIAAGDYKGKTLYFITSLKPEALWNLRNLINAALGKNVAGKAVNFDPDTLVGKIIAITTEDTEFDGKVRSQVQDIRPKEEMNGEEDEVEDEEAEDEDEEEEEEDLEDVDVEDI